MGITAAQLWDSLFLFMITAMIIEFSLAAIFSIKIIDELLKTELLKSLKNVFVILVSFGICLKLSSLRIFGESKLAQTIPPAIHLILSALVLSRLSNLMHDLFKYLKRKSM